jgi:LysM repeat protein
VRSGDTLDGISQRTGVSVADLKRINGLKDADLLQVGQVLRLSSAAAAPRKGGTVTIRSGDTLESIAKGHQTNVEALLKANPGIQPEKLKVGGTLKLPATAGASPSKPATASAATTKPPATASAAPSKPATAATPAPSKPTAPSPATPAAPPTTPPPEARRPDAPPLTPPVSNLQDPNARGRWRYYGDTVVDWGSWKRLQDGVRFTLVQAAATDVGEGRAQATAIAVDCSTLRHTWRVKEAWEAWTVPAPRSVGQQIVLDLCGNTAVEDRRPVPPPPSPTP